MSEISEIKDAIIDVLICKTLIERSKILAEKDKLELYNKDYEFAFENLRDNSNPLSEYFRSEENESNN